jgi:hypothetical protein
VLSDDLYLIQKQVVYPPQDLPFPGTFSSTPHQVLGEKRFLCESNPRSFAYQESAVPIGSSGRLVIKFSKGTETNSMTNSTYS